MKILGGSSNTALVASLAKELNVEELQTELTTFPNGETKVWIKHTPEEVAGENIILVQSFSQPVDSHIVETLLLIDALERLGARHISLVVPWFGYSLQDKVFRDGEPIAAKVVANLLSHSYVKRAFLLDLHNTSTTGFFAIPSHHISALQTFVDYSQETFAAAFAEDRVVAASPDFGGLKRARVFANYLSGAINKPIDLVNIDKHRNLQTGEVSAIQIQGGDVTGKIVLIMDDVIVSGGTVVEAAKLLKQEGAAEVHFLATHGLFVGNAFENLSDPAIDSIVVTNTVHHESLPERFKVLDIAPVFAKELKSWM
jgi:ribose-phosphate pyrophosphokinase